jgi:hypothetical protein
MRPSLSYVQKLQCQCETRGGEACEVSSPFASKTGDASGAIYGQCADESNQTTATNGELLAVEAALCIVRVWWRANIYIPLYTPLTVRCHCSSRHECPAVSQHSTDDGTMQAMPILSKLSVLSQLDLCIPVNFRGPQSTSPRRSMSGVGTVTLCHFVRMHRFGCVFGLSLNISSDYKTATKVQETWKPPGSVCEPSRIIAQMIEVFLLQPSPSICCYNSKALLVYQINRNRVVLPWPVSARPSSIWTALSATRTICTLLLGGTSWQIRLARTSSRTKIIKAA